MDEYVKLYFEVPIEDSDDCEIESLWASPSINGYKLENIPFYARGVSFGDVVLAEEKHGCLYMSELLEASGHSTVRILFIDKTIIQSTRKELRSMGCGSEISDQPRLIAVDIPPSIPYENIRSYLDKGKSSNKWYYEEACLGFL